MEKTSFENMRCPLARALAHVGEWWNILIIRDVVIGRHRFDEFQKGLGIAPNTLTRRLASLVRSGILEKKKYTSKPPRYEYHLTQVGIDFVPILFLLCEFGKKHFSELDNCRLVLRESLETLQPVVIDLNTQKILSHHNAVFGAGPEACAESLAIFKSLNLPIIKK